MFELDFSPFLVLSGIAATTLGILSVRTLLRFRKLEKSLKDHRRHGHHTHGMNA